MSDAFDPYYKWLGIPAGEQPPNHYRLLGVMLFEADPEVIESAGDRQMSHVRSFQSGKHSAESQKVLNELSAAKLCLLSADKKAAYDQTLKAKLAGPRTTAPLRPTPIATSPENLGIDPLASSMAPRHRKRKSTSQQPALLVGAGAAVVAVIGLVWALAGNSDDPPAQLTSKPSAADDHKASGPDRTDSSKPPADHAAGPKNVDPPAADVPKLVEPAPPDSADDSAEKPSDEPKDNIDTAVDAPEPFDEVMEPAMPDDSGDADLKSGEPASAEPDDAPAKAPVPDADALKAAIAEIQSLLKADFSAAKKPDQRIALAEKLLSVAKDSDAPTERYALLSEAERLAASAGDAGLAMQAIDAQAEEFAVDRLELAADMLDSLASKEMPAAARKELVEVILPLVDEATAAGQFKLARRLAAVGLAVARKVSATDAAKTLARQTHDLAAQEKLADAADAARKQLAEQPDDAEAHLTLGKYLCLVVGDWDAGLPHLKQGSDPALRSIAERELAGAEAAADQVKLGDLWWDLTDDQKGVEKDRYRSRAGYWYEQAIGELTGLSKAKVEKRLADLPASAAPAPPVASRGGVIADRVLLWNTHDNDWNDRGMLSCNVELRKAGQVVWSRKAVPVAWKSNEDLATTVPLPKIAFDALRVETVSFQGLGAGLCEIEVFRGKTNLARGKPVIASSSHNASRPPDAVVDGIRDSSRRLFGYWVALDRQLAWIEVQIVPPVASNKDSVYLADLPAHDVRIFPDFAPPLSLKGTPSPHGVFLHPRSGNTSHAAYDLAARYQSLAGKACINDSAPNGSASPLTFRIVGDGRELWRSRPLQRANDVEDFRIPVSGVRELELFVDCPDSEQWAHALWFDPKLTSAAGARRTPPSNVSKSVTVGKWIDLLPLADPARQHLEPDWRRTAAGLHVEKREGKLPIPMSVDGEYSLHVEFTRKSGRDTVVVILPIASGQCMLALSGHDGAVTGFEVINGQELRHSPASIKPGTLENEHRYSLDVTVHRVGNKCTIETKLDGKPCVHWSGEISSLWLTPSWAIPRRDVIALAGNEPTDFHVARFKLLSGKATIDADAVPQASLPAVAPAKTSRPGKLNSGLMHGAVLIATFDDPTIVRKKGEVSVRDLSGKQKPGRLVGATLVPGLVGRALNFDKIGDLVDFGDDPSLNPPAITACAWVQPKPNGGQWGDVLNKYHDILSKRLDEGGKSGFVLRLVWTIPEVEIGLGNGSWHTLRQPRELRMDEWFHVAATYDDKAQTIYLNGQSTCTQPSGGPIAVASQRCYIGSTPGTKGGQFSGLIDEVALFDRALSADEVRQIYELGAKGKSLATGGKK